MAESLKVRCSCKNSDIYDSVTNLKPMMNNECVCTKCYHPICPPVNADLLYNEVSHEIGDTRISIKVAKDTNLYGSPKNDSADAPNIDVNCTDAYGKKCRDGCTKVNVIPNEEPPLKTPNEKMFLLKSIRQIIGNDELKNTLELEFKLPRNYLPLPKLHLPPPIIVPKTIGKTIKKKRKKKDGKKKKKRS